MKRNGKRCFRVCTCAACCISVLYAATSHGLPLPSKEQSISFNRLGAAVDGAYGAPAPVATKSGFTLASKLQALEAEVGPTGLRVTSLSKSEGGGSFSIVPVAVNSVKGPQKKPKLQTADNGILLNRGFVTERVSASSDGIRQDFIIAAPARRASPAADLVLRLALNGATAARHGTNAGAALLTLASGRKLVYSRLHVTDTDGRVLPARMEIPDTAGLRIIVAAAGAAYPITIDPTITDADWISLNSGIPGIIGKVYALVRDSSGNLYAGGEFKLAGDAPANNIAKWDGASWSALGTGLPGTSSVVKALALDSSDNLTAGGFFVTAGGAPANCVAKWNGASWSALGQGITSTVQALSYDASDNLTAGGSFTGAGGIEAYYIARWNGTAWSTLGSGMNQEVTALARDAAGNLYAGGSFTEAGGSEAKSLAKWDGTSWSASGTGIDGSVAALAFDSTGNLYVGGNFSISTGDENFIYNVAKWNGTSWSALGTGIESGFVTALAFDNATDDLHVGGSFAEAGGIAKWNGTQWSAFSIGVDNRVYAVAPAPSGGLYIGGEFAKAGDNAAKNIARWNGSAWSALGSGMNDMVNALAFDAASNIFYAGGVFTTAGSIAANGIVRWDGAAWSALGAGMGGNNPYVNALAFDNATGTLYAGGSFTTAGGTEANYIAQWRGTSWSALGAGMSGTVNALALDSSDNLTAAGQFSTAGGIPASNIAKWNGSEWSALGSGINSTVYALAFDSHDNLFAGGWFTAAGGTSASRVAQWDGSAWSALGNGVWHEGLPAFAMVAALAVDSHDNLYAGGMFTGAGDIYADYIAKWNGAEWSTLGDGVNGTVSALAVDSSDNITAAGGFTTAGGFPANRIAKWNGTQWSALGSGLDGSVRALAQDNSTGNIFVAGDFITAGNKVSPYIALRGTLTTSTTTIPDSTTTTTTATADCSDNDADGYGNNCAAGPDCNDNDTFYNEICPDCTVKIVPQSLGWFLGEKKKTRNLLIIGDKGTVFDANTAVRWDTDGIKVLKKRVFFKRFMFMRLSIEGAVLGEGGHRVLFGSCRGTLTLVK